MIEKEVILTDKFIRCRPGRPGLVTLTLTDSSLSVIKDENCSWPKSKQKNKVIPIDQIVGCNLSPKRGKSSSSERSRLSILVISELISKNGERIFQPVHYVFETTNGTEDVAVLWRMEMMQALAQHRKEVITPFVVDRTKKLVVMVNPKSGDGRATKMFQNSVLPALEHSATPFELITTQRPNHGRDFVASQDLSKFSGLVIVSGDGLLHEVIQGIFQRPDALDAIKIPLGIVPAGSGNGLARSLAHINKEKYDKVGAFGSILNLVSGHTKPMDLTRVKTHSGKTYYSFLSIGWGFLADCDIESERLRFMGEPRFALWAAVRVINLRHYKGRIHYKPALTSSNSNASNEWELIEDEFISVYCVSLPWIGTTLFMAPESTLSDGVIYLNIIRKGVTRVQLSAILQEFESGNWLNMPGVESYAVSAFKIEPLTPNGHLTLDGELIEYGPLEGEVLQGCARIMSKS